MEKVLKIFKSLLPYIIIIIVVVLIRSFIITPGIVSGDSMYDTLEDKEVVLVNKIGLLSGIKRFDIVVLKYNDGEIIKRVIGLPNETVKYANNVLYINGKEVKTPMEFEETDDVTIEAGENEYVVMGDNRDVSKDSRLLGAFNRKDIIGKVNIRLFPLNKIGIVK